MSDAQKASGAGLWSWNITTDDLEFDEVAEQVFQTNGGAPRTLTQLREVVHPDDHDSVETLIEGIVEDPGQYAEPGSLFFQYRIVNDGAVKWLEVNGCVTSEGDETVLSGSVRDITRASERVQALQLSADRYRLYTSLVSDFVYEIDPKAGLESAKIVAGSFADTIGGDFDDTITAEQWQEVIHPDDRSIGKAVLSSIENGVGGRVEYRVVSKDGMVRWMRDHFRPELDADGNVVKFHGAVQNITAQKRLEQQVVQSQKNEALARFSANAARDFDNLLTVILGAVELATTEDANSPEMIQHLLETIRTAAEQAGELTRGMLLYGQRISGRPTRVEVGTVVGMATAILRQGLGRQHVLNMEIRDTPVHVLIDPAQLQLMLLNLVVNARHAMPTGGQVSLTVEQKYFDEETPGPSGLPDGSFVSIEVHDTGVGIAPETLPHIFEPFFTTKLPGEGVGLGLAACRGIVTNAGGTITADSPAEGGAKFTIFLPVEASPSDLDEPVSRLDVALGHDETVLVVDDDPMLQRVFKRVLEEFGYTVATAGSGIEALEALEEEIFDIVVTDVVMPEMDGLELARTVRQRWQDVPVLLMSGRSHDGDDFEALTKPIRPRELALKIREVLDA